MQIGVITQSLETDVEGMKDDERNTQGQYHHWISRISNRSTVHSKVGWLRGSMNR